MTHAVFSSLFSEIQKHETERAESDGKVAEVGG